MCWITEFGQEMKEKINITSWKSGESFFYFQSSIRVQLMGWSVCKAA